jgi:hypothetical protein
VTSDGQQLVPVGPVQLIQRGDHLPEVPLGQLLGLVVVPARVGREPQHARLTHLVLVELPSTSGLLVDHCNTTPVVLVQHR